MCFESIFCLLLVTFQVVFKIIGLVLPNQQTFAYSLLILLFCVSIAVGFIFITNQRHHAVQHQMSVGHAHCYSIAVDIRPEFVGLTVQFHRLLGAIKIQKHSIKSRRIRKSFHCDIFNACFRCIDLLTLPKEYNNPLARRQSPEISPKSPLVKVQLARPIFRCFRSV